MRLKLYSLIALLTLAFAAQAQRVAVLGFKANGGVNQQTVDGITAIFTTYFQPEGYTMVESPQIDDLFDDQAQSKKGVDKQLAKIGKLLNVSKVVMGDVNLLLGRYNVDARVINLETGTIDAVRGASFADTDYRAVIQQLAEELALMITDGDPSAARHQTTLDAKYQSDSMITLFEYLHVFPRDLGVFDSEPSSVISRINQNGQYGYCTWRIPTNEELSLLKSNDIVPYTETYLTQGGATSGRVRLVTDDEPCDQVVANRAEAERQRMAAEAERQRLAAEAEQQRLAAEAERQRLAAEAEQQRLAAEAERQRLAAEAEAERQRLAAEAEAARLAAEAEAERQRLAAEAEAERQRLAAEAEAARLAAEAEAERQRLAAEAEAARLAAEAEAERQRIAAEEEAERQRLAAEAEAERQRLAAEAEAERLRLIAEEEQRRLEEEQRRAEAERRRTQPQTFTVNGVSFELIYVKGGSFMMGCTSEQNNDCNSDESPTHRVTLSDYYIGKFEVTQALWEAVMSKNPSNKKGDDLPVENVSWNDVQEFISQLNQLTGMTFSLPTEAQWEYAARGGAKSKGYKYSGGNNLTTIAWFADNSGSTPHEVGTKEPNELGLYDMSGNVWEWCNDWYGNYSGQNQNNPTGPATGSVRVLRGGSWSYFAGLSRVSYRLYGQPGSRFSGRGFRLVLNP